METPSRRVPVLLFWTIAACAAVVALAPLLVEQARRAWAAEHYRFFPLLLLVAVYLGYHRIRESSNDGDPIPRPFLRTLLWAISLAALGLTVVAGSPFFAVVTTLVLGLAAVYEWGGARSLRAFLPIWLMLWIAVPLPFGWDRSMVVAMQRIATIWASGVLDLAGYRHLPDGVAIKLPERDFFVDEACSGVHSLFATLAFTAVFAVASRHGFLRSLVLLAAAVGWVLVGNAVRVCAIVVLSSQYDLPVTDGLGHELIGVVAFALVVGLVLSTDRFLLFLAPRRRGFFRRFVAAIGFGAPSSESERAKSFSAVVPMRRGLVVPAVVTGGMVLLAAATFLLPEARPAIGRSPYAAAAGLKPVPESALPSAWNGWQKVGFETREREADDLAGEFSRIWYFRKGRLTAAISIDGPFEEWHDTSLCYRGLGHEVVAARDVETPEQETPPARYTELDLADDRNHRGFVLFMAYSESDKPLAPPRASRRDPLSARLVSAIGGRLGGAASAADPGERVYQVQLFTLNPLELTGAERTDLDGLFNEMRRTIAKAGAAAGSDDDASNDAVQGDNA